ncbi:MAG: response regulator, partial [Bacteroidota bacterium]
MNFKILVADELKENRELLVELLKNDENQFKILTACDGEEAFQIAIKENPAVILLDWNISKMNGIEVTKLIKKSQQGKNIPILLMTTFSSSENLQEAFAAGVIDYIKKPVNGKELISRINVYIKLNNILQKHIKENEKLKTQFNELQKLSMVVTKSQNSFILINNKQEIIWVNDGFKKIHGCSLKEYIKKFGNCLNDDNYHEDFKGCIVECREKKGPTDFTRKYLSTSGKEIWLQVSITPIFQDRKNGEVEKFILVETDITRLKEAEEALSHKNEQVMAIAEYLENANELLEKQKHELERRGKELREEKMKTDELLRNILPFEVALQLQSKGKAEPRHYKSVTVMFTDFKGFSKTSKDLSPKELVNILDSYFVHLDEIIDKHYLEKIKTIGDAYMCVGGLPLRNNSHAFNVVLAALEIQYFMNSLNDQKVIDKLPV